jgi:transcriptional regulator GlxA family with amidase domain
VSAACAALAKVWRDSACADRSVAAATRSFLRFAFAARDPAPPAWLTRVQRRLADDEPVSTRQIASDLKLHPVWLARAYRAAVGEGLQQTIRRRRVERAVSLLAESDTSPAQVAVAAGFCDQSHMIRCFGAVLGRTPREIRRQQRMLREAGRQAS